MPTDPYRRRDFAKFCTQLEQALDVIELPPGLIKGRNIATGAVSPENCNLRKPWTFIGPVTQLGAKAEVEEVEIETDELDADVVDERRIAGDDEVYFLDAKVRTAILTLPPVSSSFGRRIYIKRIDSDTTSICHIETTGNDKIDLVDRLVLEARQAYVLIASKTAWQIVSSYSP